MTFWTSDPPKLQGHAHGGAVFNDGALADHVDRLFAEAMRDPIEPLDLSHVTKGSAFSINLNGKLAGRYVRALIAPDGSCSMQCSDDPLFGSDDAVTPKSALAGPE